MRAQRAAEIVKSPHNIEVVYNNTPIWIDSVDEVRETASVRLIETNSCIEVSVNELNETGKLI